MALPLIPIIMATMALGSGIAQGITSVKNAHEQTKALKETVEAQINERAKAAKKLMSEQKTSFLKSGVYFSGTPEEIINETYQTAQSDIGDMAADFGIKSKNLYRQGKTAFYSSVFESVANAAGAYFLGGGSGEMLSKLGGNISNSKAGAGLSNWYNSIRGWNKGGFGPVTTKGASSAESV